MTLLLLSLEAGVSRGFILLQAIPFRVELHDPSVSLLLWFCDW